jgi:prolyl-tRNA editing enzyme YbaK/EbsC (Cys-tRNA(Pro) deacylase)
MRRAMPLFVHEAAAALPRLFVSAGQRGVQLEMPGPAFLAASGATAADLVED